MLRLRSVRTRGLACIAALVILSAGCTQPATTPAGGPVATGQSATGPSGALRVAVSSFDVELFDPSLANGGTLPYNGPLFDPLVGVESDGRLSRDLGVLDNWSSTDAKTWLLHMRDGITWHDGAPMTSADIKFTLEYHGRKEAVCGVCGTLRSGVAAIDVVDRQTVSVRLSAPNVVFPNVLGMLEGDAMVLPKHYVEKVGAQGFNESPVGSGPWRFVSRRVGEFVTYSANEKYWNRARIPQFAELTLRLVPEDSTRVAMLQRGEIDLIQTLPSSVPALKDARFKILGPKSSFSTVLYFYRSWDPAFLTNKLEFRKALALAIDWDPLVKKFYPPDVGERHKGGAPPFTNGVLGVDLGLAAYAYSPDEAKRLLQAAGYSGQRLDFYSFTFQENPEQREVNEVIASMWRAVGVNVQLVPVDWAAFRPRIVAEPQKFDSIAIGVQVPTIRPSALAGLRQFNISGTAGGTFKSYWDPRKADQWYAQLGGILDEGERDKKLREINREMYSEYWSIPIVNRNVIYAASSSIAGWPPVIGGTTVVRYETIQRSR